MSEWLKAYEKLNEEQKVNVQRWLHLNKFIARTLKIPEQTWFEGYVGDAMKTPFDFSFMEATIPGFGGLDVPGQGESFTRGVDPTASTGPKIPLRAQNNLGRLSPELQDRIAAALEKGVEDPIHVVAADVAMLQKLFPGEKALARLKRPDFKSVRLARDMATDDMVLSLEGGAELARVNLHEFGAVMSRKLT